MKQLPASVRSLTEGDNVPALPDANVSTLARLVDASPEDFQKGMAALLRRLAIQGFRNIQAPRNYKELATVLDLLRKAEELDKDKGNVVPAGLVGVLRSVNRRTVVEVGTVDDEPGFS